MKYVTKRTGLPLALVTLGIVMAVVGIIFSTVARPSPEVNASLAGTDAPYIMTHEGVLDLFESDATITATAEDDSPIVIAVGRSTDISAWLDGAAYVEIVGLSSWTELKINEETATSDDTQPGSPATSDMWVRTETGTGSVSLTQPHGSSDLSVIIATDGDNPAPAVTITWQRSVSVAWAVTLIAVGAVLALLGLTLAWQFHRSSKNRDPERRKRELEAQRRLDTPVKETIEATAGGKTVKFPSRRALREARERGEAEVVVEGRKFDTGLIPVVEKVREVDEAELPGQALDTSAGDGETPDKDERTDDSENQSNGDVAADETAAIPLAEEEEQPSDSVSETASDLPDDGEDAEEDETK
ncbi:MAG: hypothetical protein Q4P71_00580 [Actinomycetaceae bacterium]|nr:hypothetical protein [Actinomycetaceae bacterium]